MQQLAIYGGSFNPVHNGHLILAEEIRQILCLDKIIFMPAAEAPHKPGAFLIEPHHRLNMLQKAIEGNPYFTCSEMEVQRGGKSYTIDTLRNFRRQSAPSDKLYFILGSDAFLELATWKQPHELLDLACFIVIERPGASLDEAIQFLQSFNPLPYQVLQTPLLFQNPPLARQGARVFFVRATLIDISSSVIRQLVQAGKSIRYLVPDEVKSYIDKQQLYR